ncbi:hypothetical protein [Roseinatronobacter sp. S2]|uniref:hypothetical protein n=1 Tax=Roseinatronobacter sp. S2 TaxID=3035471 RepID=UPI0024109954|nr:hypothetical protein [Roseinatronobacter sp. S2]WFE75239.1 hypothetical protein P8S53_02185 [Roseinatronobacter sp. S2]
MFNENNTLCTPQSEAVKSFSDAGCRDPRRIGVLLPSRATRKINFRSRVSGRASLVRLRRYDQRLVHLVAESVMEIRCVNLLMSRRDIVDIWDQPAPVKFTRSNGKTGSHTFDYLVKLASGERVAIAVKPYERAFRSGFKHELTRVAEAMPSGFADTVLLHTEQDFPPFLAVNAARMCEYVKNPDPEADEALLSTAHKIHGRIRLSGLVELSNLGARAHRAAHRLLYDGYLKQVTPGIITPETMIEGGKL